MINFDNKYKQQGDENLLPHFYVKEFNIANNDSYDTVKKDYIKIKQIGSGKVLIDREIKEDDKLRFEEYYIRFRENKEQVADGHAIIDLPTITPDQLKMCKGCGINTIEQLANIVDTNIKHLGMNGRRLVECAKKYLAENASVDLDAIKKTEAIIAEKNALIEELQEEIKRLKSKKPNKKKVDYELVNDSAEGSEAN